MLLLHSSQSGRRGISCTLTHGRSVFGEEPA